MVSYVRGLRCKECGAEYPLELRTLCDFDFAPVEIAYDLDLARGKVTRESIAAGPRSLWRYRDLLPLDGEPSVGLTSGFTPLVRADNLARELGVDELYLKDDGASHPSLSYKDRVVSVALSKAIELGYDAVACASTGNLANAVAALAAKAGVKAFVLIPEDLESGKVVATQLFGATIVKVRGNYDQVNRLCVEVADKYGWAVVNDNLRAFYTEGAKTHAFEIAEQLGWRLPRHSVLPVAGGTLLPKVWKAYQELIALGLVPDEGPQLYAAQAAGCNPLVEAMERGWDDFKPQKPQTLAKSIAIGDPPDGYYVLQVLRESAGSAAAATDPEILAAMQQLARTEGIFTEPAGGATLAAAKRLIDSGRIPRHESICVSLTGNGLKSIEALQGALPAAALIGPSLSDFDNLGIAEVQPKENAK